LLILLLSCSATASELSRRPRQSLPKKQKSGTPPEAIAGSLLEEPPQQLEAFPALTMPSAAAAAAAAAADAMNAELLAGLLLSMLSLELQRIKAQPTAA
jgi:hypothetical protein